MYVSFHNYKYNSCGVKPSSANNNERDPTTQYKDEHDTTVTTLFFNIMESCKLNLASRGKLWKALRQWEDGVTDRKLLQ